MTKVYKREAPPLPRGALDHRNPESVRKVIMNHKAMVQMAREHTTDAIVYLVFALRSPKSGVMARLKAAELLLAYGWGKPPQAIAISTDTPTPGQGLAALTIIERVRAVTEATLGVPKKPIDLKTSDVQVVITPTPPAAAGEEFV